MEFEILLDYALAPTQARELLKLGAAWAVETGRLLANPQPDVVVVGSEPDGIRYLVRFYVNVNLVSESSALTDAMDGVVAVLAEEGIDLSTPPQRALLA